MRVAPSSGGPFTAAEIKTLEGVEACVHCCGSAGIYNLTQPDLAGRLLEKKLDHIAATGASIVAVGNPGCALQIGMGPRRRGLPVRVMHPAEILAASYGPSGR